MRRREVELIAALVEGRLPDETEARALIDSSDEHREEYHAQLTAYQALSSAPPVELTEQERAALRRDIWTELQSGQDTAAERAPWYYRWSYAAAGLVVVIGLVAVVTQGGNRISPTAGLEETATLAGADSAVEEPASDGMEELAADEAAPSAEGGVSEFATPDTAEFAVVADRARAGELDSVQSGIDEPETRTVVEMNECIALAGLTEHEVVGDVEIGDKYVVAVPIGQEVGPTTPISFVHAQTCELVYTHE